jgi:hypothetical protein
MNRNVRLAYLVHFHCHPFGQDFMDLMSLHVQHNWLERDEPFVSFALRVLRGRLR